MYFRTEERLGRAVCTYQHSNDRFSRRQKPTLRFLPAQPDGGGRGERLITFILTSWRLTKWKMKCRSSLLSSHRHKWLTLLHGGFSKCCSETILAPVARGETRFGSFIDTGFTWNHQCFYLRQSFSDCMSLLTVLESSRISRDRVTLFTMQLVLGAVKTERNIYSNEKCWYDLCLRQAR